MYIYIYMRVFVLIPLASFKCKNSKGKRIFSLAIERGIDLFSCATSGNGKEAFSRGGTAFALESGRYSSADIPARNSSSIACTEGVNICHDSFASSSSRIDTEI